MMTPSSQPVRTRFAPSPTGELHLGSARTALHAYLFAKGQSGQIALRIEDTDQKRFVPGSMDRFMNDLKWLGIHFDGEPVIQSSRAARHREVAEELVQQGAAYYEATTTTDHGQKRHNHDYRSGRTVYRGADRDRIDQPSGSFVIRLKVPAGKIVLTDLVRGRIEFDLSTIDDQVLLKSDGMATYHLAAMVDDHDMEITHIIRTEEWLPSTPKHLLIFQAMNWQTPKIAHLPIVLNTQRQKLSKRKDGPGVWISTYRTQGYLAEAMINYLAFLGWNPGDEREFFTLPELVKEFSLERVHAAGAIFDVEKLKFINAHYLKRLPDLELVQKLRGEDFLPSYRDWPVERLTKWVHILRDRVRIMSEFELQIGELEQISDYSAARLIFKKSDQARTRTGLDLVAEKLKDLPAARWEDIEQLQDALAGCVGDELNNGDIFWPTRVALSGQDASPSPAELLWALGRDESLTRLKIGQQKLEG